MGRYDKRKGNYGTRNKTTVAPYPNPDAEVLAGVFDVVNRYYGNGEEEFYTEEGERNIKLEQIVQSGSFPKIFNAIQQDIAPIVEPPENPEDVHGEWVEYELGDEDDIARAARGTGWCVASPSVGTYSAKSLKVHLVPSSRRKNRQTIQECLCFNQARPRRKCC